MHLALLHYSKAPVIGGVERVLQNQEQALVSLGHQVEVLTRVEWDARTSAPGFTPPWQAILVHNLFTMPFDLEWTRQLTALTDEWQQIKWINWIHDIAAINPAYRHLQWSEPLPRALHVAVSATRAREWAEHSGVPLEDIRIIPNGLDFGSVLGITERILDFSLQQGLAEADVVLLHPARLVRRKRLELSIAVLQALRGRGLDACLVLTAAPDAHQNAGDSYHRELLDLIDSASPQRVLFAGAEGPLSDADLQSLYALSDLLFFPSSSEGFGLPLLEASWLRLPVWCSDLPVHRELLDGHAHFFSVDASAEKIAADIAAWLGPRPEIGFRRQLLARFHWQTLLKERLEPLLEPSMNNV
jgi:glycosyltransferase involved in cell wall biosynthesis